MKRPTYRIETYPNAYGFGRDYTLIISYNGKERRFWLGQDAKVFSRILGIDMQFAIEHYTNKAKSKDFNKVQHFIAEDILKAVTNTEQDFDLEDDIVIKVFEEAKDWSLAVQ